MKNICETHNEKRSPGGICAMCRNEKTLKAVIEYTDYDGPGGCEDLETGIYDLVANLLHLAHDEGISTDRILEMGQMHFTEELREQLEERRRQRKGQPTTPRICPYLEGRGF